MVHPSSSSQMYLLGEPWNCFTKGRALHHRRRVSSNLLTWHHVTPSQKRQFHRSRELSLTLGRQVRRTHIQNAWSAHTKTVKWPPRQEPTVVRLCAQPHARWCHEHHHQASGMRPRLSTSTMWKPPPIPGPDCNNSSESLGLSRRGRKCSQVIPHPPAAPFFEHLSRNVPCQIPWGNTRPFQRLSGG